MTDNKYNEWRVFTPILLVVITVLGAITSYFVVDKLNAMDGKSDKLFSIVGGIKSSFDDYKVTAESHFATLDTKIVDISARIDGKRIDQ